MMVRKLLIVSLFFYAHWGKAQLVYEWDQSIPVYDSLKTLNMAWAGGINSAQVSTIDLDGDAMEDLVIFDRTSDKISTYLFKENRYTYAPVFESQFPPNIQGWMLLRDYNCDGLKDLFTHTPFGIKVYKNTTLNGTLSWQLIEDPIFTLGLSGQINLQVSILDLPGIDDLDGDGDLDILVYNFAVGGGIEYHKNLSIENSGTCGLEFERKTKAWGDFLECQCDIFAFGDQLCDELEGVARIKHVAGKSILTLDMDDDGDKEVLIGQEDCKPLYYLENVGTQSEALMRGFSSLFPNEGEPIEYFSYPAAYYEDLDGDGLKDLVSSPNFSFNYQNGIDFSSSFWFYQNINSTELPEFRLVSKSYMQDLMIDPGESASPSFTDFDRDGDEDLFISHKGSPEAEGLIGSLWFFQNTGNATEPEFSLVDKDYLGISSLRLSYLTHQFIDINKDENEDLVFMGSNDGSKASIYILINQSNSIYSFDLKDILEIPIEFHAEDHFHMADINGDEFPDLLLARSTGQLNYYRNTGNADVSSFLLDTESFYGISSDFSKKKLAVAVSDLNADSKKDLLTIDERGKLRWYSNFLNIESRANPGQELSYKGSESGIIPSHFFGRRASITTGNIFSDAEPTICIGLQTGGIQILRKTDAQVTPPGSELELKVIVYPNPTLGINNGRIKVSSNQSGIIQLFSYSGQEVSDRYNIDAGQLLQIETLNLPNGLYLLRTESGSGKVVTNQLVIIN